MARSKIRDYQVVDEDFLSEDEHRHALHQYKDLADLPTYSGYGGKYLRVKLDGTGMEYEYATISGGADSFLALSDTPGNYSGQAGKYVQVKDDETGLEFATVSGVVSYLMQRFAQNPTYDGEISVLGWYYIINTNANLSSGSPITVSEKGYNSLFAFNVKSVSGAPFTTRLTGTSVSRIDGSTVVGDTCDITVSGTGYFMGQKAFLNAPQVSIVEGGKSCTMDIYKASQCSFGEHTCTLLGADLIWTPDQTNWEIHIKIEIVNENGSLTFVDDIHFDRYSSPERAFALYSGRYARNDYNASFDGSKNEGVVIWADQRAIGNFILTVIGSTEG